jgi:sporulation protein YlmC with PRC-barrel domain
MTISSSDIMNLPVFTASGRHLGRVSSFDLELEAGAMMITYFYVRTGLIKGLWHEQLVIHRSQVVSVDREKMVVEDAVTRETAADLKDISLVAPAAK